MSFCKEILIKIVKKLKFLKIVPIYKITGYERKKIMNLHSTWPGTYSFVFEMKTILSALRAYIDTVLKKIDTIEEKIAS